jgi:urease subunit alpha
MFGSLGRAVYGTCLTFVSKLAIESRIPRRLGLKKRVVPVKGCRKIGKKNLLFNDRTPKIEIDPETYEVRIDGRVATVEPASTVSQARLYNLF